MKNICILFSLLLSNVFFSSLVLAETESVKNHHLLGAGDQIQILVYNEPDLSMKIHIDGSGEIMYPLLGDLKLSGKTTLQVANEISDRLKDGYVNNPMVTVTMLQFGPIYVSGEVKIPGSYQFEPGLTLEKTIAVAGGFTDRADRDDISIRRADGQLIEDVNPTEVIYPGDIVIVEQSFF